MGLERSGKGWTAGRKNKKSGGKKACKKDGLPIVYYVFSAVLFLTCAFGSQMLIQKFSQANPATIFSP